MISASLAWRAVKVIRRSEVSGVRKPHREISAFVFGWIFSCLLYSKRNARLDLQRAAHCVIAAGMGPQEQLHSQSMEFELRTTREIHS